MTPTTTEPIVQHWTTEELLLSGEPSTTSVAAATATPTATPTTTSTATPTAAEVNAHLARIEVADVGPHLVPYLAAAAAELALLVGTPWRFSTDDPPVALLRMIARVTMKQPDASGPHTARLFDQLR